MRWHALGTWRTRNLEMYDNYDMLARDLYKEAEMACGKNNEQAQALALTGLLAVELAKRADNG